VTIPKEPTSEECTRHIVFAAHGAHWLACWYPQMGGYVARCLVRLEKSGCFDAYVWHDGEWPFTGETDGRSPVMIHHCDADQFIRFGNLVKWAHGGTVV
jgi:hypothetical protein